MIETIYKKYKQADKKVQDKIHLSIYEAVIAMGCIFAAVVMLIRVFYGTEITDEAFYVSDAVAMMHGNVYCAYDNYSYGTGGVFLMIPFLFIYQLFVPTLEGVFLYTRICYMIFYYAVMFLSYRILKKDYKRSSALLVTGFMIAYAGGGNLFNFSYNTSPFAVTYLAALLIYDAIEHENKYSRAKLIASGVLLGLAVLGNIGYGVAIVVQGLMVLLRTKGRKEKFANLLYCMAGGFAEMLAVFVPVIAQTSLSTLIAGIRDKLNPYPNGAMYSGTTSGKWESVISTYMHWLPYLIAAFVFVLFFSIRYIRENEKKLTTKGYVRLAFGTGMFLLVMYFSWSQAHSNSGGGNWYWGFLGSVGMAFLLLILDFREHPVILYMGLYPVVIAIGSILGIDSSASVGRYAVAVSVMAVYLLVMLNEEGEISRTIATVSIVACILAMGIGEFRYVYRDEHISALDYRVESGVYKGIYTTAARAADLPELEEYLNTMVNDEDYYAYRDNVPAAYLMTHKGTMCDKDTWDCLNYSYHHGQGTPNNLYTYYVRRGVIPTKVIYVDYGRDENLSIEDPGYMYNEFINTYYEKVDEVELNETFYHVIVYKYKGGFDGNFDYWLERHAYKGE